MLSSTGSAGALSAEEREAAANLWKLMLMKSLHMGILVMPVIVVFWRSLGLSITQIFVLQAIFAVVVVSLEVPSGYLADWLGRRAVMAAGYAFFSAGMLTQGCASEFWGLVIGETLMGVGSSMVSGTDTSILFDTLKSLGREREFARQQGRMVFATQIAEGSAAVLGGLLGTIHLRLPFFLYGGQLLLAAATAVWILEPKRETFGEASHGENLRRVWAHLRKTPELARYLGFFSSLAACSLTAVWLYQPHWQALEIPLVWFGPLWAALNFAVAFAARAGARLRERLGLRAALWTAAVLPGIGFLGLGLLQRWPAIAFALCIQTMRGFNSTLVVDEINRRTGSEMRATVNSIGAGGMRLIFCTVGLALGMAADRHGLPAAFLAAAAVFGGGALALRRSLRA